MLSGQTGLLINGSVMACVRDAVPSPMQPRDKQHDLTTESTEGTEGELFLGSLFSVSSVSSVV